jgi:dTDP-4-amino-4,6-dideoxygalactose transaminase
MANETLSLPIYPEMTSQQVEEVCDAVTRFASAGVLTEA